MLWVPDAVEAALIAGGVSLAGLLITNQSKVSEFRQAWINALRDDMASLVTHALEIYRAGPNDDVGPFFVKIHEAMVRIRLRLNPEESESKAIFTGMENLREAIHSKTEFDQVTVRANELASATQVSLKKEWDRVKSGEPIYKWTFRLLAVIVFFLLCVFVYQKYES